MPQYRLEMYQGGSVLRSRTVELPDDEAAERELLREEDLAMRDIEGMSPEELIRKFAGGSISFRARREPNDPEGLRAGTSATRAERRRRT